MGSSAAGDEALEDPFDLDRRGFAAGLIAAGLFAPAVVHAQTPPPPPDLAAPAIEETPRLLANLLTRMATRTSLNGRGGYQFVLDTGAGRTSIAEDIAAALEMPPGPSVLVTGSPRPRSRRPSASPGSVSADAAFRTCSRRSSRARCWPPTACWGWTCCPGSRWN